MTAAPRILFLADYGPEIGGGHVMRCLTLAHALMAQGAECAFVGAPGIQALVQTHGAGPVDVLPAEDTTAGAASVLASAYAPDWLVVDHYGLSDEAPLRAPARRLLALDDLADRPRDCDLLLDPGYGRTPDDHAGLVPADAQVLAGPAYALVRPAFRAARLGGLRDRGGGVERVLVCLGLTDAGGHTARVVRLLSRRPDLHLDVAVGSGAPTLADIGALAGRRIDVHVDAEMAPLMAKADLAVGAGGSSTWERACLGLPGLTLVLADNQRALAGRMAADGLTIALDVAAPDFGDRFVAAFDTLAAEPGRRTDMSARLAALCDGLGAERVAKAMLFGRHRPA